MDYNKIIGSMIREIRTTRKMSLRDLEERTGISNSALSNYETGKRAVDVVQLDKICKALDADMIELLTLVVNMDVRSF